MPPKPVPPLSRPPETARVWASAPRTAAPQSGTSAPSRPPVQRYSQALPVRRSEPTLWHRVRRALFGITEPETGA
jgi:hypothetical protein